MPKRSSPTSSADDTNAAPVAKRINQVTIKLDDEKKAAVTEWYNKLMKGIFYCKSCVIF